MHFSDCREIMFRDNKTKIRPFPEKNACGHERVWIWTMVNAPIYHGIIKIVIPCYISISFPFQVCDTRLSDCNVYYTGGLRSAAIYLDTPIYISAVRPKNATKLARGYSRYYRHRHQLMCIYTPARPLRAEGNSYIMYVLYFISVVCGAARLPRVSTAL